MKDMTIEQAQRDVREVFRGGAVGQAVSGLVWLLSTILATIGSPRTGLVVLILGGIFIFPLTQLALKLITGRSSLEKGHPMNGLAVQVAFIVPLCIPVILGAVAGDANWFYPAFLIVVGAHYMPFVFLYGMREFGVLAALMMGAGIALLYLVPDSFTIGGWIGAAVLLGFSAYVALARKDLRVTA